MYGANVDRPAFAGPGYLNARPGYEVRVLIDAANVLARRGEQQPCEDVLTATRAVYKHFLTDMKSGGRPIAETPDWREKQIRAAVSVSGANVAFRSDELLGVEVRSPNNLALGSVDDLVLSPQTGKIAYLVIARGGIFGIGEKYVSVPWEDFKVTPKANLLVLDTSKSTMDAAPRVTHDQSMTTGQFNQESPKVDAYWKTHLSDKASN